MLIDNQYLVLFINFNIIKVYEFQDIIDFNYKMTLPLYEEYRGYLFFNPLRINLNNEKILSTFY
jgi:hypothetical protein